MRFWRAHVSSLLCPALSWMVFGIGLSATAFSARAQDATPNRVVVGDVTGRWDPTRFSILTSRGVFPVFGSLSSAPFFVRKDGDKTIAIQFRTTNHSDSRHPKTILYRIFPTERRLISALILDEVDFAELHREESAIEVRKSNPTMVRLLQRLPPNTVTLILYNLRLPLFRNRNVRVAISHAINRRKIVHELLGDKATIARGPLDDASWAYASGLPEPKYDPRRSLRLLAEAGWKDRDGDRVLDNNGRDLAFTLTYPEGLLLEEQLVRQIKLSLSEVGIHLRKRSKPMAALRADLASGNFEAMLIDLRFEESGENFRDYFGSDGENNFMGFSNRVLDKYLQIYAQSEDRDTRRKLLQAMQLVINREQPVSFLYFKWWTYFLVNSKKLEDVRDGRGGILPLDQWRLKPTGRFREP